MAIEETTTDRTATPAKRRRSKPESIRIRLRRQIDTERRSLCRVECAACGRVIYSDPDTTRVEFSELLAAIDWTFDVETGFFYCPVDSANGTPVAELI